MTPKLLPTPDQHSWGFLIYGNLDFSFKLWISWENQDQVVTQFINDETKVKTWGSSSKGRIE